MQSKTLGGTMESSRGGLEDFKQGRDIVRHDIRQFSLSALGRWDLIFKKKDLQYQDL